MMGPLPTPRDVWEGIWGVPPDQFWGGSGDPPAQFWGLWVHPPPKGILGGLQGLPSPLEPFGGLWAVSPPPGAIWGGHGDPHPPQVNFGVSPHLHPQGVGDDTVHQILGEGVKGFVPASHELGFEQEPAASVVLEQPQVQLHRYVWGAPWGRVWGTRQRRGAELRWGSGGGVGTGNSPRFGRIGTSGARRGGEVWGRVQRRGAGSQWGAGCSCGGQRHSVPWGYGVLWGCATGLGHVVGHAVGLAHRGLYYGPCYGSCYGAGPRCGSGLHCGSRSGSGPRSGSVLQAVGWAVGCAQGCAMGKGGVGTVLWVGAAPWVAPWV